jgi:hypothetical protein
MADMAQNADEVEICHEYEFQERLNGTANSLKSS